MQSCLSPFCGYSSTLRVFVVVVVVVVVVVFVVVFVCVFVVVFVLGAMAFAEERLYVYGV